MMMCSGRKILVLSFFLFLYMRFPCPVLPADMVPGQRPSIQKICGDYIREWKRFYPARSFSMGFYQSIYDFEDYSEHAVKNWIAANRAVLKEISSGMEDLSLDNRIDARLLRMRIREEIDRWEREIPHRHSLSLYVRAISGGVRRVSDSRLLLPLDKVEILLKRMQEIERLCFSAINQIEAANLPDTESDLKALEDLVEWMESGWEDTLELSSNGPKGKEFQKQSVETAGKIRGLIAHIRNSVPQQPPDERSRVSELKPADEAVLGREAFARRLELLTDSDLTPELLAAMALEEIQVVRELMDDAAVEYLRESDPARKLPDGINSRVGLALKDMESAYPSSQGEYIRFWKDLAERAEKFVREHKIATLPDNQTLSIVLAPESSGPRARIGWVSSSPPFIPNPWTTIFLPTIPDTHPEKERTEFWRSFNNYFTRFIVIHELFPGHYIQNKINRENPHFVRILFPYPLYSEGWATLCEKVALDAGWDDGNKLTVLAHLRKRLENANRAYTSVQVHCSGWDREQVRRFSIETSLLAPQFAKSLWGRLMGSPMQITTYFLGTRQFSELYQREQKRRGPDFRVLDFMDTILRAGPIPLDEFEAVFDSIR